MQFIIKEISPSRKEIRISLAAIRSHVGKFMMDGGVAVNRWKHPVYIFGTVNGAFDVGTLESKYIPDLGSNVQIDEEPNYISPRVIHNYQIIKFIKDSLFIDNGFFDYLFIKNDFSSPIINFFEHDEPYAVPGTQSRVGIEEIPITPTIVIKLLNPLPSNISKLDAITIQKQILSTQEQDIYYIPETLPKQIPVGLDYDEGMIDEVGNVDSTNLNYENYDVVSASFGDRTVIDEILSGSDPNLKVNYSKLENHVHFGSAVTKLENFKSKIGTIEDYLVQISQSLLNTGSSGINTFRENLFNKMQDEKNSFTPYEKFLYYKSHKLGVEYQLNIQENYIDNFPLVGTKTSKLYNTDGFYLIYKTSGSNSDGTIELFKGKYNVENKPFYNNSGSFYLSFLMKGDESIGGSGSINNIVWENRNENYIPKLPHDTLYTSSLLQPSVKSGSWQRYIYHASMSYFAPVSSNPIIGAPGSISDFSQGSSDINILHGDAVTGSYGITAGSRYSNLATIITSSGAYFTGSVMPAGELFRIYINTNVGSAVTSSYLTDIKITKTDPTNFLPFGEIYGTGSYEFANWYNNQQYSASLYDEQNLYSLNNNLPEYIRNDINFDYSTLRKFIDLLGEYYDLIKNYIDNYGLLFSKKYDEFNSVPENILPVLGNQYNWEFMLPFGQSGSIHSEYAGSTVSNINKNSTIRDSIWKNILNNIVYIYKTKGTHNSIRALLNSHGFPPDILKLREHGASLEEGDTAVLNNDVSNLLEGIGGTPGNVSFVETTDKLVSYVIDSPSRKIGADWRTNSVDSNAIEFIFKGTKTTNTQTILKSSGSGAETLWDMRIVPSASSDTVARISVRISTINNGNGDISSVPDNAVEFSSSLLTLKDNSFWNVLFQRTTSGYASNTENTYELYVGNQSGDKIKSFSKTTQNIDGTEMAGENANNNFIGTGSRGSSDNANLVIGEFYTGSIAEVRTWKNALSASKFKQHIFDKKSVVGNSVTGSRGELIYHYRLNENWPSGSSNPKIKDYNPINVKDYSLNISINALGHTPLYNEEEYERIQFVFKGGGSYALDDNNILIDPDVRFINNLNPLESNTLNVFDPFINKRKASSIIEIVRSPQDVINDFILNQIGNFDFNDKFSNPPDIYEENYKDLDKFAKDFFDHYNISLDINKYIRAQATIFNRGLTDSLRRLIPARSTFSKIGIELKPIFLERSKIKNHRMKVEAPDIKGSIYFHDFEKNIYSFHRTEGTNDAPKKVHIELASAVGSVYYNLSNSELYQSKDGEFYYWNEQSFTEKLTDSFSELSDTWGTSSSDLHFVNYAASGKYNDYNTYHYDNRYIFRTIGDVESLSGSYSVDIFGKQTDSFHTEFTSSKDFKNHQFIQSDTGLGLRFLGVTHQFKTGSITIGKWLDNDFVYPANHDFIVGSSKESLNNLYYDGTQNNGGILFESEIFNDLSTDAFYTVITTGENRLQVNRGSGG